MLREFSDTSEYKSIEVILNVNCKAQTLSSFEATSSEKDTFFNGAR